MRQEAVWDLERERDPRAAGALAKALKDSSEDVRLSAAMVLEGSDWDGPEVTEALTRATLDPHPEVRRWSVKALGRRADSSALPALHRAKMDPQAEVRRDAVSAIERIDFALQAREVRYHPPAILPSALLQKEMEIYLRAHEDTWTFTISRVSEGDMTAPSLSLSTGTICEHPEIETKGAYHGQADAVGFLQALHRRVRRDPRVLEDFRTLRTEALNRFPLPKEAPNDQ